MSTLDFSKLAPPKGETFEGLVRLLGERLGMVADWSGRGADGGRDLIFVETLPGQIKARVVRWLVSCKNNSDSSRSVTERDVVSVRDKLDQHKCDGFLLATTTTVSTGLKEMLDKLDSAGGGPIQTKVWDRFELTKMLLSDECAGLLLQFFPEHQRREAVTKLDAAREIVEAALPRFLVGEVRTYLVPAGERWTLLSGSKVWPYDANQQAIIDVLKAHFWRYVDEESKRIEGEIERLKFDTFMAFSDALIRNFPSRAVAFLKVAAKTSTDNGVSYNAIAMLRESGLVDDNEELEITCNCNSDVLYALYHEWVEYELKSIDWTRQLEYYVSGDYLDLNTCEVSELTFEGGQDDVSFTANIEVSVAAEHIYDDDGPPKRHNFNCKVDGHLASNKVVIGSIECDLISNERMT